MIANDGKGVLREEKKRLLLVGSWGHEPKPWDTNQNHGTRTTNHEPRTTREEKSL